MKSILSFFWLVEMKTKVKMKKNNAIYMMVFQLTIILYLFLYFF